jgi:hypothetical protein
MPVYPPECPQDAWVHLGGVTANLNLASCQDLPFQSNKYNHQYMRLIFVSQGCLVHILDFLGKISGVSSRRLSPGTQMDAGVMDCKDFSGEPALFGVRSSKSLSSTVDSGRLTRSPTFTSPVKMDGTFVESLQAVGL